MSGRKNNLRKYNNIANGDMSLSSITSPATNIQFLDNIGIQFNFTGTPTGTFQVQVSADYEQDAEGNITNPGNWVPLVLTPTPVAAGSAGSVYVDITMHSAPWMRVAYVKTSGTGTLNSFITAKMV